MEKQINTPLHTGDTANGDVANELKTIVLDIETNTGRRPFFADVTSDYGGYPKGVGEYKALVGFVDQRDAQRWALLTGGEMHSFYKKDGWHLLSDRGVAWLTSIYQLAGKYPVIYPKGDETIDDLCYAVLGRRLNHHLYNDINGYFVLDDVNGVLLGIYRTEYPAYYSEWNEHWLFGVLYPAERESEIQAIIDDLK